MSGEDMGRTFESVWDYPRPPKIEPSPEHVIVRVGGETIAETRRALRVLETSHPPVYYIPLDDVRTDLIVPAEGRSYCEFKGEAAYVSIVTPLRTIRQAGWTYPGPSPAFNAIAGHIAFYASRIDEAFVNGERVVAQEGDFYGGWITSRVRGPFKGAPGTRGW